MGDTAQEKEFTLKLTSTLSFLAILTASTTLSLIGAHSAAAQTTIYSYQADGSGQGTTYTGGGVIGSANFQRTSFTGNAGGFNNYSNSTEGTAIFSYKGNFGINDTVIDSASDAALLRSYNGVGNSAVGNISLTGLAASTSFDVYFYGVNGQYANDGRNTTFQLASVNGGASGFTTETTTAAFGNPANYVMLTGISDTNGAINATYFGSQGNEGDFNGAQFVVGSSAPEPSQFGVLALVVLALAGLMARMRLHRNDCPAA